MFDVLILYFIEQGIRKDATFQGPSRLRALDMFVSDTVPPCTLHICYPLQSATCPFPGTVTGTAAHSAVTKFGISGKGAELESNPKSTVLGAK